MKEWNLLLHVLLCKITWAVMFFFESADPPFTKGSGERTVSYLPLSHAAAQVQIADIHLPICVASTVYFAQSDALKGSLAETLREVRPTLIYAVPGYSFVGIIIIL